jgi:hypothetical protein
LFSFGSLLRLYKGAHGPESDSCSEGTRLARDGHQSARKKRKSERNYVISSSQNSFINKNEIWLVHTFVNVETAAEDVEIGSYVSW